MNVKNGQIAVLAAALTISALVLVGCKKSEPEPATPAAMPSTEQAKEVASAAAESIEQTICPVMGNPIDKSVFIEYQGKKVYFCCPECEEKFKQNPEQYVAKLPQFDQ